MSLLSESDKMPLPRTICLELRLFLFSICLSFYIVYIRVFCVWIRGDQCMKIAKETVIHKRLCLTSSIQWEVWRSPVNKRVPTSAGKPAVFHSQNRSISSRHSWCFPCSSLTHLIKLATPTLCKLYGFQKGVCLIIKIITISNDMGQEYIKCKCISCSMKCCMVSMVIHLVI